MQNTDTCNYTTRTSNR